MQKHKTDRESGLNRLAEVLNRYGLVIVVVIGLSLIAFDRFIPVQIFDSPSERGEFLLSLGLKDTRVLLFVTEWCGSCRKLEHDLGQSRIPFARIDIEKSEPGRNIWERIIKRTRSFRGIPKVVVDDRAVQGTVGDIEEALLKNRAS